MSLISTQQETARQREIALQNARNAGARVRREMGMQPNILQRIGSSIYRQETGSVDNLTARTTTVLGGLFSSTTYTPDSTGLSREQPYRIDSSNLSNTFNTVTGGLNQFNSNLTTLLKPVSTFLGGTLATLTGIMQDPLGAISALPRQMAALVEKVNPGFAAKLEGTFKKYNMDALFHLPGQIVGSIRNLLTFADAVLSLPIIILQDIYNGLMEVMEFINELIDSFMTWIYNFFFGPNGILNAIIPIGQILAFIQEVSLLAGEIGGLAGAFLGSNPISAFTLQVQGYASQVGNFLQNPFDTLFAYAPPQVSQALYTLRNPQQMINSILPPQLSQLFAGVSKATGLGFNGNMGYGFGSVLNGLRGGVLSSILSNFSAQYPILTPLLGLVGGAPGGGAGSGGSATSLFTSIINPNIKTSAGGFVQPQQLPQPVIPYGSSSYAPGGPVTAYGFTQQTPGSAPVPAGTASGGGISVPRGSIVSKQPDGTTIVQRPDGTVNVYPRGTDVRVSP